MLMGGDLLGWLAAWASTRAALLTGRHHHSVGTAGVVDHATGYPGYNSVIPRDTVAIGEILRQHGHDTSWYGKDHNTPRFEASQAGPDCRFSPRLKKR